MSTDFAAARLNMVESQIRTADVTDLPLQCLFLLAIDNCRRPRHRSFLKTQSSSHATAQPIKQLFNQWYNYYFCC